MKSVFIENGGGTQRIYESLLVEPADLSIFSNGLAMKIISELGKKPLCAIDLAKKLGQHEQKVYYHLRKMRDAGIVQLERSESRYGMTAKIYALVSPVIAAKLYENSHEMESAASFNDPEIVKFLFPFIKDGKLNSLIITGDPYPHGKYDIGGLDGCYATELAIFLGNFLRVLTFPCSKLDVRVHESELKNNNLIVVGNMRGNTITQRINNHLPIRFDEDNELRIVSTLTSQTYNDDLAGIIIKCDNPFNRHKKLLVLAGRRTRGTQSAAIGFTKYVKDVMKGNANDEKIVAKVVHGIDSKSDGVIDEVKFLE